MSAEIKGSYTIEHQDNILVVSVRGPFNESQLAQYHQDMCSASDKQKGKIWGSLVIYYGSNLFTPESENILQKITQYRMSQGMIANATVILESKHIDIQQMQLKQVLESCQLHFHVFSNVESARSWLTQYLHQQSAITI